MRKKTIQQPTKEGYSLKYLSKRNWGVMKEPGQQPTEQEIIAGALQRIAERLEFEPEPLKHKTEIDLAPHLEYRLNREYKKVYSMFVEFGWIFARRQRLINESIKQLTIAIICGSICIMVGLLLIAVSLA